MVRRLCELRSIFLSPTGARKTTSNEQNVCSYYMLNHQIRCLLFHYKKNCYFAIGVYCFGKSIKKHPDSLCENDNSNEVNVCAYYNLHAKLLNERLIILPSAKKCYFGFYFLVRVSKTSSFCLCECSFCIHWYSPCCKLVKPGPYTVLRPHIFRVLLTFYSKMT